MRKLLLHPTSTAQWYELVNEAQSSASICLNEELESYLVFLLMRFSQQPQIANSVLGLEFLNGVQVDSSPQPQILKDVGDKCLLFSGLFPGRAKKRRVKVSYFVKLGQSAYSNLSQQAADTDAQLFANLCLAFTNLMDVLQATRDISSESIDLLQNIEQWQETGSKVAWQQLDSNLSCPGNITIPSSAKKSVH